MELLERLAQGELEAFETLFRQFQGQVYGWILRIVRDTGAAEDLTVETFWRIYRSRARFNPAGNFGAWTRRIATNVALDHLKSVRREVELPDEVSQGVPPDRLSGASSGTGLHLPSASSPQDSRRSRPWRSSKRNPTMRLRGRWESRSAP